MSYTDGSVYEGDFVNGLRHGTGSITLPNGDFCHGEFTRDELNGNVRFTFASDGRVYEGKADFGRLDGPAIINFKDGSYYDGEIKNAMPNGTGTLYKKNGEEITAEWKNGEIVFKNKRDSANEENRQEEEAGTEEDDEDDDEDN